MSEVHVVDKDRIHFHPEQLKYLKRIFPTMVFSKDATHSEMLHYNGQQSVLQFVEDRVK